MNERTNRRAVPLRQQVYLQLRGSIEQGAFAPGSRLPPTREHAQVLGVGRNTVLWAVERLKAEGYVVARVGDGSYVAPDLGKLHPGTQRKASELAVPALSRRGHLMAQTALRWRPPTDAAIAFRLGSPAVDAFPFAVWERLSRQTSPLQRRAGAQYIAPAGHAPLREAIAQWVMVSRGIRCDPEQVFVTSGSQQAIDLISRLLLDVGDEVMVEDPGYPGIRSSMLGHGVQARAVPVDAQGFDIDEGAKRWPAACMAVVTPSHQFPLGIRMSLVRRLALLDWARSQRAWVVEDDYDGEFQYGPHRIPALRSLAQDERVLYVGTFSKTLHPGLRLGFIILPHSLVDAFTCAKALSDRHSPSAEQDVLARFILEGHLLRHLRRMRELYAQRQHVMIDALSRASGGLLQLAPSEHGMHLVHELPPGRSDLPFSRSAAEAGVFVAPLSRYAIESKRTGFIFGYAGYEPAALRAAARKLGPLLRDQPRG